MITATGHSEFNVAKIERAVKKGSFKTFAHAAASLRKQIIDEIQVTKETIGWITTQRLTKRGKRRRARIYRPAPVGHPVFSHRNKGFIRRGVKFEANAEGAVIGFAHSVYGDVMRVHEFGGERKGESFDARPTLAPALRTTAPRFAEEWRGAIGQ